MTREQLRRYADLLLFCVGGVDGRNLLVKSEIISRDLVVTIARRAYESGARLVDVNYTDPLLIRSHVELADIANLASFPDYKKAQTQEYSDSSWSLIRLTGSAEPDYLNGVDTDRIGTYSRATREMLMPLFETVTRFRKHWVGGLYPTEALAHKAFPELPVSDAFERYESAVVEVLCLDEDDPIAIWRDRFVDLSVRRDRYNDLGIDSLHFEAPGTDLTLGMIEGGRWSTAEATMADGRTVYVNMPSLEVFTSPDLRRATGRVSVTKPYISTSIPGRLITGAWFEFQDGAVTQFGADSGSEIIERVLSMDDQARCLGEIALVDDQSAVAKSGVTFFNTLYDENASIHIALGRGFPRLVEGIDEADTDALIEHGVNHSLVHDDMMIGSSQMTVTATTQSGDEIRLMENGRYVY